MHLLTNFITRGLNGNSVVPNFVIHPFHRIIVGNSITQRVFHGTVTEALSTAKGNLH